MLKRSVTILAAILAVLGLAACAGVPTPPISPDTGITTPAVTPDTPATTPTASPEPTVPSGFSGSTVYLSWTAEGDFVDDTLTWVADDGSVLATVEAGGHGHRLVGSHVYYTDIDGVLGWAGPEGNGSAGFNMVAERWERGGWAISPDERLAAWVQFHSDMDGTPAVTSELYIADLPSGEPRLVTTWRSEDPEHLTVWGFSPDSTQVIVYRSPWGIGGYILFEPVGLFSSVDLATGEITPFPEPVPGYSPALLEPDLSHLLRVHYVGDQRLVTVLDLATGQTAEVGTVPEQYRQAGRPLLSPDGKRLVYSAAVGTDPEGDQFAIYEINLGTGEQHALLADQPVHYIPVVFEEDGSLLVVIAWLDTGTARLYPDGTLEQVSGLTYLGRMP